MRVHERRKFLSAFRFWVERLRLKLSQFSFSYQIKTAELVQPMLLSPINLIILVAQNGGSFYFLLHRSACPVHRTANPNHSIELYLSSKSGGH